AIALAGCSSGRRSAVTVYVSEDQVFSEPILKDFERDTGIKVNAVFDTEEAKSTGVMNRLLAQKNNPQADVYWANEPVRPDVLKQQAISTPFKATAADGIPFEFKDPDGYWIGFSARARLRWSRLVPARIHYSGAGSSISTIHVLGSRLCVLFA